MVPYFNQKSQKCPEEITLDRKIQENPTMKIDHVKNIFLTIYWKIQNKIFNGIRKWNEYTFIDSVYNIIQYNIIEL